MEVNKVLYRYLLLTMIVLNLEYWQLDITSILVIKLQALIMLCLFLDYYAVKEQIIRYYNSPTNNSITVWIWLTIILNYGLFDICLYLSIQHAHYPLNSLNILGNYLLSIPIALVSSILFYYIHRLLHTNYFYFLHKKHHIFNHPSSIVSLYNGIPDFMVSNCISTFVPHLIFGTHRSFIVGYTFIAIYDVFVNHTSYCFNNSILNALFGGSYFHYIHHSKFIYNYGLNNGFLDRKHKTLFVE